MIASFFNVIAWDDLYVETLFQMAAYINSKKTASDLLPTTQRIAMTGVSANRGFA